MPRAKKDAAGRTPLLVWHLFYRMVMVETRKEAVEWYDKGLLLINKKKYHPDTQLTEVPNGDLELVAGATLRGTLMSDQWRYAQSE